MLDASEARVGEDLSQLGDALLNLLDSSLGSAMYKAKHANAVSSQFTIVYSPCVCSKVCT
jgi:hypothetical protein